MQAEPQFWTIVSTLSGSVSAVFAAVALWQSSSRTQLSETFQHLRDVNTALAGLGAADAPVLQAAALAYTRHETDAVPERWTEYQALLDTLELLAFAVEQRAVNRRVASSYLRSILGGHLVPAQFLRDYQRAARNPHCYEALLRFVNSKGPPLPPMTGYPD
ncbi:hypothetical protein [Longimicrobium terrae]|uniref:Uncharacterized protein n=1 Tax=Longimicrobium terrae TaxID=1639882 RepID=A0A841GT26_9BACT|nr:hypothetical protein [Longimicrobium terrae]MBB4635225.1 hypothetical protein [Longimicrobium terrae]MBB6069619.1 hypothetical protein [Longimicrobium terrae]NNC31580.1 hypothetical protein [Longimicrobium terrae]